MDPLLPQGSMLATGGKEKNLVTNDAGLSNTQVPAYTSGLNPGGVESTIRLPAMLAPGTSFEGQGGKKPRTAADLKHARESRANEALKMKDEQLKILSDQNSQVRG